MKLKNIFLFLTFGLMNFIMAQDTVRLNGTSKVTFKVQPAQLFFVNCSLQFNTANTSVRTISGIGKILFKPDGSGYIIPVSTFKNGSVTYYQTGCKLKQRELVFITYVAPPPPKDTIVIPPSETKIWTSNTSGPSYISSQYNWGRTIGNSSAVQFGPDYIKALRTPTGIADLNGDLVISTGLVEGSSGIFLIKNNRSVEIGKPKDGDITLNVTSIASYDGILYCVGFDSYDAINSALIAYKDGQEYTFQYGKTFRCKWQDNAYKSGIHVNIAKITGLDVDASTLYVYCGSTCYMYDRITGQSKGTKSVQIPVAIAKAVSGKNIIEMTSSTVTFNGKTICSIPTSPKITNYNFIPKDFNTYETKGSVCFNGNSIWITDAGNCRILHYDTTGKYIGQVAYLPMNYNCSVDQNNPTRVFAKELEFKIEYPTMKWVLVNNWGFGYGSTYQYKGDNKVWYFLKDVSTTSSGTFAIVRTNTGHDIVKLTETGLQKISSHTGYVSMTSDGKVIHMTRTSGKANFYIDGILKESVTITSESALNGDGYIGMTTDGTFVVSNNDKNHNGYHLTWVKNGSIKNAMPSKNLTESQSRAVPFEYGGFFPTGYFPIKDDGQRGGYAGSNQVYTIGNRVFYNYLGEFFGGDGGQTNLWFEFVDGEFVKRVGMTVFESYALDGTDAPRIQAGNTWGGDVVFINGKTYIFANCEHTGAISWFEY